MTRASFRQADLERIMKAAKKAGSTVQVDLRTLVVTVIPVDQTPPLPLALKPDGKENWDTLEEWQVWKDSIPPSPVVPDFDWREGPAVEYLAGLGADVKVHWRAIKNFGTHTQKKLQDRGYIKLSFEPGEPEKTDEVWLTKAGMKAWNDLKAYRKKHQYF